MANSRIEWTEKVWNPVTGCNKISPGCKNCYAEAIANRFWKDRKFTDVELHPERIKQPLFWRSPSRIFVNSMSDLFHEDVPFAFIDSVFEVMGHTQRHTFQILTKRPERAKEYFEWTSIWQAWGEWNNIWLGVSVEDQNTADKRIPILLQIPHKNRWISVEPMLEKINLFPWIGGDSFSENSRWLLNKTPKETIKWVVCGGESGPSKRRFEYFWAKDLLDQCTKSKVPFFMKQIDKVRPIPEDLRIREYPENV